MNKRLVFFLAFALFGIFALQIPLNQIIGSQSKFTLFDLWAPVCGAFIGSIWGVVSVLAIQVANIAVHGFSSFDKTTFVRLFPTLFGVWFFSAKGKKGVWILVVPIISIIVFNLNTQARGAWFYSLFWTIPVITWFFKDKFLLARSLGATFTIHGVGSVLFAWAFNLPTSVWASLVPITMTERLIFALGISASYILLNNILGLLASRKLLPAGIKLNKKYLLRS